MKAQKWSVLLLFIFMMNCKESAENPIIDLFYSWSKEAPQFFECLEQEDKSFVEKLVDKSTITENFLEFSESCDGQVLGFANIVLGEENFIFIQNPDANIEEEHLGLIVYKVSGQNIVKIEEELFDLNANEIQNEINSSSSFLEVNQEFNGEIPFIVNLSRKGEGLTLIVNPEFSNENNQDIIFGTFRFTNGKLEFLLKEE